MSSQEQDTAEPYIRRREKNLQYFKKFRPELYDYFHNIELDRIELSVTPGESDVDLLDSGRSVYRNHARAYSLDEVEKFLAENDPDKWMKTLPPPWEDHYSSARFSGRAVKGCFKHTTITSDNFTGYRRGKSFPSVVFLGCGLAYHIEALVMKADIVDAVVFEPDAQRFAVSLFTVDWERICSRFHRKGCNISFSIATSRSAENSRAVLGAKLTEIVPLYPHLTVYYNHLANVELFQIAKDLQRDIPLIGANWGGYDFELRGLNNIVHNLRSSDGRYIQPGVAEFGSRPVFIVGSGPSVDLRIEDIRKVRSKAVVISAGTGIRVLLSNGIKPDIHVELDADYSMVEMLGDLGQSALSGITLVAAIELNPRVPELFERTVYFFRKRSYVPAFFGVDKKSMDYCNPTCTNAALAVSYYLGLPNVYLFGTDYGYREAAQHHSEYSVYGTKADTEFARDFKERKGEAVTNRKTFDVKAVDGGVVKTRSDFYTAKRQVEEFINDSTHAKVPLTAYNCSDGAAIDGAEWTSREAFLSQFDVLDEVESVDVDSLLEGSLAPLPADHLDGLLAELSREIHTNARAYRDILRSARLSGRRDLIVLANQVRDCLNRVGPGSGRKSPLPVQMMGYQMLKGTIKHFLFIGLCHGLAYESDDKLVAFAKGWKKEFEAFLKALPGHFDAVILDSRPATEDPWVQTRLSDPEPDLR